MKAADEQEHIAYEFGLFRLDPSQRTLLREGRAVPLLPKSFDTLLVLVRNSGRLLDKEFLLSSIWPDAVVEENSLAKAVSDIRRALSEGPKDQRYVVTVPRRGYRFAQSVKTLRNTDGAGSIPVHAGQAEAVAQANADPPVRTVAVLPFTYMSQDGGGEYLGVGMADALITRLSKVRQIVVRPTSAVLKYADVGQDLAQAGQELKVDFVISGSVRRDSERVRVTVQLVSTQAAAALWADKFDEGFTDIFAVEDSISERVAAALSLRLTGDERRSLTRRHTENPEAHQLYLRGRYFWSKRSLDTAQKAAECFRRAIELDADYALAYAGLADSHIILGVQAGVVGGWAPNETYPVARHAAARALGLDERLAEAHASLGYISFYYDWAWPLAQTEYQRALELNPHYATAHHWYAMSLMCMGQTDQALARIEKAQELDPHSLIINANGGSILYHARRYDEAVARLREIVTMEPDFVPARYRLGVAYVAVGMYRKAETEFLEVERLSAGSPLALAALGYTYAISGRRNEAQTIPERLTEMSKRRYVPPANIAEVYAGLGEQEQALDWLEKACHERDHALVRLVVNPWWDNLRSEPRFQKILRRIGLWR